MSSREDKLFAAKTKLCSALGESGTKIYMSNLKQWFRKVWTKEQFDFECRKLFTTDQKHLHNDFFLAILNKITQPLHGHSSQSNSNNSSGGGAVDHSTKSSKKRKRSSRGTSERVTFTPIELFDYLPEENVDLRAPSTPLPQPRFAAQELFLPDTGLILGRLLVAAWENGLTNADEDICDLMVVAVQILLKNIITAVIKARKNYRVTGDGQFFYDIGCAYKDPCMKNTASRQIIDDHLFEVDKEISSTSILRRINDESVFLAACENVHQTTLNGHITIVDLYNALQNRNLIPCHSVYANNIERISQQLN